MNTFACDDAALATYKNGIESIDSQETFQWYIDNNEFDYIA
jgi:hypothetical protein